MSRAANFLTTERLGLLLSVAVGLAIGLQVIRGEFDYQGVMWSAIAVLGLLQLRILVRRPDAGGKR